MIYDQFPQYRLMLGNRLGGTAIELRAAQNGLSA
jgi:hypothetical protein